jgi:hypothetical protein
LHRVSFIAVAALLGIGCGSSDRGSDTSTGGSTATGGNGGSTATGGGGGTTATGGAGGAAQTDLCVGKGVVADGSDGLIDDLEDNDNIVRDADHRVGTWNASGDTGCTPAPAFATEAPLAGNASNYAAHASETGCIDYGHSIALSLNAQGAGACGYDASTYDGVYFWAAAPADTDITFNLHTSSTIPMQYGGDGTCDAVGCWNGFAKPVTVTTTWTLVQIPFTALAQQPGWGVPVDWDVTKTSQMSWSHAKPGDDFWIDNVGFYKGNAPTDPPAPGGSGGSGGGP